MFPEVVTGVKHIFYKQNNVHPELTVMTPLGHIEHDSVDINFTY